MITAAPRCGVAYVSFWNQAERSSSRTLHKQTPHQGLFKGCNGVRLKVNEKKVKGSRPKNKPPKVCKPLHWNLGRLEVSHFSLNLDLNLSQFNLCT